MLRPWQRWREEEKATIWRFVTFLPTWGMTLTILDIPHNRDYVESGQIAGLSR
jgi:hypothetical protein